MDPLKSETSEEELKALFCKNTFKEDYKILNCEIRKLAGMTDVFALDLYRKINGNSLPAV